MAVVYEEKSSIAADSATKPTGVTEGDLMVMYSYAYASGGAFDSVSGWTTGNTVTQSPRRIITRYRLAGASEPASWSTTHTSATCNSWIMRFSNVKQINPVNATAQANQFDYNLPTPACTPIYNGCLILRMFHYHNGSGDPTPPSGDTSIYVDGGNQVGASYYVQSGAAGPTNTNLWTMGSSNRWLHSVFAITPASNFTDFHPLGGNAQSAHPLARF